MDDKLQDLVQRAADYPGPPVLDLVGIKREARRRIRRRRLLGGLAASVVAIGALSFVLQLDRSHLSPMTPGPQPPAVSTGIASLDLAIATDAESANPEIEPTVWAAGHEDLSVRFASSNDGEDICLSVGASGASWTCVNVDDFLETGIVTSFYFAEQSGQLRYWLVMLVADRFTHAQLGNGMAPIEGNIVVLHWPYPTAVRLIGPDAEHSLTLPEPPATD